MDEGIIVAAKDYIYDLFKSNLMVIKFGLTVVIIC